MLPGIPLYGVDGTPATLIMIAVGASLVAFGLFQRRSERSSKAPVAFEPDPPLATRRLRPEFIISAGLVTIVIMTLELVAEL